MKKKCALKCNLLNFNCFENIFHTLFFKFVTIACRQTITEDNLICT